MADWEELITDWANKYGIKRCSAASSALIDKMEPKLGPFPPDLKLLYQITNGFSCDWLEVFPMEDPLNIRRTWNGLVRNNTPKTSQYFRCDTDLFSRFCVFANIGGPFCAAFDRHDFSIWYEDADDFSQTNLSLSEFLNTCHRESREK